MPVAAYAGPNSHTGNGVTTLFAYSFRILDESDLKVTVDGVVQTLSTHYTVAGEGDSGGGSITFLSAPANLAAIVIERLRPYTRATDYQRNGAFDEETVDGDFDSLVMQVQQLAAAVSRAFKPPVTVTDDQVLSAAQWAARHSLFLGFNASGTFGVYEVVSADGLILSPFIETLFDDANAAEACTTLGALAKAGGTMTGPLVFAATQPATNLLSGICEGRLTLTTATPVTTGDVTAAETIYFTPFRGNRISVYNGTNWLTYTFTELSLDVPDVTGTHDVFLYDNAGTLTLEALVWTNATTRATALALQNGVLVKSGDATRRYLGTFYSTTAGNGQVEDSYAKRNLWNYYNRVDRPMRVIEATDSWNYTTATWRQANAAAANQLEYVQGVSEDAVVAMVQGLVGNGTSAYVATGVGVDSTSVNSATVYGARVSVSATKPEQIRAEYRGFPGVGRHLLVWLEISEAAGTSTWYGDNGGTLIQSGMTGVLPG